MKRTSRKITVIMALIFAFSVFYPATGVSAVSKPNMPTNLQAQGGYKSVTLKWDGSKQNFLGYRVWMSENGGKSFKIKKTLDFKRYPQLRNVQKAVYKVEKLEPYKEYKFRVLAYVNDEKGRSLSSSFRTVTAEPYGDRPSKPDMPKNLKAHPGYKSVILQWDGSKQKILGYKIWLSSNGGKSFRIVKTLDFKRYPNLKNVKSVVYKVGGLEQYKSYKFRVLAYVNDGKGKSVSSSYKTVTAEPVREMWIKFRVKGTGETLVANRVSGGVFITPGGRRVSGARTTGERAIYTTAYDYSRLSAQYFINDKGFSSRTRYLVWVSTYTQRVYILKGSKNHWKCIDDWDCATGRASSPTPTGTNNVKSITRKVRSRHNVSWWSPFSSWNSLHGRVGDSMSLGRPASGGCVRNPDEKAKWIYQNCPVGTTVVVY